jgi:hypothetical protein
MKKTALLSMLLMIGCGGAQPMNGSSTGGGKADSPTGGGGTIYSAEYPDPIFDDDGFNYSQGIFKFLSDGTLILAMTHDYASRDHFPVYRGDASGKLTAIADPYPGSSATIADGMVIASDDSIYIGAWREQAGADSLALVFKSSDRGQTFTAVMSNVGGVRALAKDDADRIYAWAWNSTSYVLYRSDSTGTQWSQLAQLPTHVPPDVTNYLYSLAVSGDGNTILVGGSRQAGDNSTLEFFQSTDGGASFQQVDTGLATQPACINARVGRIGGEFYLAGDCGETVDYKRGFYRSGSSGSLSWTHDDLDPAMVDTLSIADVRATQSGKIYALTTYLNRQANAEQIQLLSSNDSGTSWLVADTYTYNSNAQNHALQIEELNGTLYYLGHAWDEKTQKQTYFVRRISE